MHDYRVDLSVRPVTSLAKNGKRRAGSARRLCKDYAGPSPDLMKKGVCVARIGPANYEDWQN